MNNLEKLTSIIQELVPDVMELKFGCKVNIHERATDEYCDAIIIGKTNVPNMYQLNVGNEYITDDIILGSPITIAIVLRGIGSTELKPLEFNKKSGMCDFEEASISFGNKNINITFRYKERGCRCSYDCADRHNIYIEWNLAQDDLSLQSEEVWDKLLEIFEV